MMSTKLNHFVEKIKAAGEGLGKSGRSVAKLVLSHPEEVALLPAIQVAKRLGISESSVVRFATAIGYESYPALRRDLQDHVRRNLDLAQQLTHYTERSDQNNPVATAFRQDMEDILATERDLNLADIKAAADLIVSARHVFILGFRSSFGLAHTLYYHLNHLLGNVRVSEPGRGEFLDQLVDIGPQDVLIGISFPRYSRLTLRGMALASDQKVKIIALTDSILSPLSQYANVLLKAHCSSRGFGNSIVAALALINALAVELAARNRKRTLERMRKLEKILQKSDLLISETYDGDADT